MDTQTEFALYHRGDCYFSGRPILGSVADREDMPGVSTDHELCCCDPYGDVAQSLRDSLRRWERRHVLTQDKVWWPKDADEPIRVKDMSVRYKRNVLAFLERRAPQLKLAADWEIAGVQMNGEHAQDAVDAIAAAQYEMTVEEWFNDLPLIRKLRRHIRKGKGGAID